MSTYYYYHSSRNQPPKRQPTLRPPKIPKFRPPKWSLVLLLLLAVGIVGQNVWAASNDRQEDPAAKAEQKSLTENKPKPVTVDTTQLQSQLEQISKKYGYNTGVAVIELNSGTLVQSGDDYPFLAASTTKILTVLAYFKGVEDGKYRLDQPIGGKPAGDQLQLMINQSDNPAWKAVNDFIGRDVLQTFAQQQGLTNYNANENTVTSDDMAKLLAKIYKREVINDQHTKLLLGWMQKTSEERFIPPAVDAWNAQVQQDAQLYHKSGYLPDRAHDVAIIDNGKTPFALVIYSKTYAGNYDYAKGQRLFSELTTATLTTFKPPAYN